MIKNILFDFDGVLAESVNVKTEAFRTLYLPFGEAFADRVVEHHLRNGGVSRFEKFRIYHRQWLGLEATEDVVARLAAEFSRLVLEGVVHAPDVPGARDFLERHQNTCRMWIVSGTPTEEMKEIARRRNVARYFEDIFGSPTVKSVWAKRIIEENRLAPGETVFVGDARSDQEAALQNGTHFILRRTAENGPVFPDFSGTAVADLTELDEAIRGIGR